MREAIKRIVARLWPEILCGYHLDRYARIVRIADPPVGGETCDRWAPKFAADIEILTPEGEKAEGFDIYEAVPLPLPMAGDEEGFFLWPRPGTIVTVRWIEGRPDHPVIQHVYPMGLKLPAVPDNMGRWQQRAGVHQTVDPDGNWERKTDKKITEIAAEIAEIASGMRSEQISGDRSETVGGASSETVSKSKSVIAKAYLVSAPTVQLGAPGGGPSLLPEMTKALDDIKAALEIIADHTHPNVGVSSSSGAISGRAGGVGQASGAIKTLQ